MMDLKLIYEGKATLEDLLILHERGFEFVIEDGGVAHVIQNG
jgi:hypothetical protein